MSDNESIRVLYIMGTARSGSTVLEILLGHGKEAFGAGELTSIVQDGFIGNKPCSCGRLFRDCEVWGRVVEELDLDADEIVEWAKLQRKIDWHDGFLRQWAGIVSNKDFERYKYYNLRLLRAIRKVTGAEVIVDSSKYAGRALALERMDGVDLNVICLTRSPEGLMASFQKPNKDEQRPKKPWAVVSYYAFVMFSLRAALNVLGEKAICLTYEQFIGDPATPIAMIAEKSNVDFRNVIDTIKKGGEFIVGHLVTGNRLRKKGKVRIERSVNAAVLDRFKLQLMIMRYLEWILRKRPNDPC